MLLNQTVVYALRAMSVLAGLEQGASLSSAELAARTGVPVHYLGKVMRRMVQAGLVESRKGHGGGFSLSSPPAEITFAEVLAAAGVSLDAGTCIFDWGRCRPGRPCLLHPAWSRLQEALGDWADSGTLAEVADRSGPA